MLNRTLYLSQKQKVLFSLKNYNHILYIITTQKILSLPKEIIIIKHKVLFL